MRVDHERERRDECERPRAPAAEDTFDVRVRRNEREERLELVHARLLRVVGEERLERGEHRAEKRRRAVAEERTPGRVGERYAREPDHERQRVRRTLGVAERAHPEAEQHVVGGRRAVLAQQARDRRPVVVRDPDGDPLVDPEACVQLARADEERERRQRDERNGHSPARRDRLPQADRRPARYFEARQGR